MAAFGRPDRPDGVIDETMEWQRSKANSTYAYTKYLSEMEVRRGLAEGLDAVIVNPALIFGTGRRNDNTRRIVDSIRTERLPAMSSGGTNVVDVEDVAEGMIRAMKRGRTGERYFLGSENLSWKSIIRILAAAFDVRPPKFTLSVRPGMALAFASEAVAWVLHSRPLITRETARSASRTYRYSNRKAVEELGCSFRPFRETAERIARELEGR
jgi:dihydroflavonol-4-reductase